MTTLEDGATVTLANNYAKPWSGAVEWTPADADAAPEVRDIWNDAPIPSSTAGGRCSAELKLPPFGFTVLRLGNIRASGA